VTTVIACPGPCNNAWRKAEVALAEHGTEHHITPAWGKPVQCYGCVERTRRELTELPKLLIAVQLEAIYGSPAPSSAATGGSSANVARWPGQTSRLLLDSIVGEMAELQADVLIQRGIWPKGTEPARPSQAGERKLIADIVASLDAHWDWAMQHHLAATEPHDRGNANPGGQVSGWHRIARRFTKSDEQRDVKRLAPCPRCHGPYLVESRELRLVNDQPYIECRDPDCGRILTQAEYDTYVKALNQAIGVAA
jgi:hypothetical protein